MILFRISISLLLSLLVHAGILWQLAGVTFTPARERSAVLPVDLVDWPTSEKPPAHEQAVEYASIQTGVGEESKNVSLSQNLIYQEYVAKVRKRIHDRWQYSPQNLKANQGATTRITFFIDSSGRLAKPVVEMSSGVKDLDQIALAAVAAASPFEKIPSALRLSRLKVVASFQYPPAVASH